MGQVEHSVAKSLDPSQTVSELKKQPGKDIWLFGGGELFHSMLELGLVDRISSRSSLSSRCGYRLLPDSPRRAELRLVKHQLYPKTGTMSLEYEVARKPARSKVSSDT